MLDIEDEARLRIFPAARDARRLTVELGAGDLLYLPIGWWRQIRSLQFSATLTYSSFLWPNAGHETYPGDGS